MSGEKVEKKKISPSLIIAVVVIVVLLAALVYYATLPPKVEIVPTTVAMPTTIVQTALKTETLPGTTIVRTEERTIVQTVPVKPLEGAKISIIAWISPDVDIIESLTPFFEKETGAKVIWERVSREVWHEKIATSLMAKTGEYDIVWIPTERLPEYVAAGLLEPLDDYIKDPKIVSPELNLTDFPAIPQCKINDKLYLFPVVGYDTVLLFYRTDLFKKYGIVDANGNPKPPETWEEYLEVAKKLTLDTDGDGKIDIYGTALFGKIPESIAWDYIYYLWSWGGEIFDPKTYKVTINSPEGVESLKFFVDLLQVHKVVPPGVLTYEYPEVYTAFQTGKIAMCIQWNAAYAGFANPKESSLIYDKFDVALAPGKRLPDGTIRRAYIGHQWGMALNAYSKNKFAAYKFMEWCMFKRVQKQFALQYGPCGSLSVSQDPEVIAKSPVIKAMGKAMPYVRLWPLTTVTPKIIFSIATHANEALAGVKTPKEALDLCAKEIETYLKEAGYLS